MKIIGMGVVGRGEADKYLKLTLDHNLPLVDKMVIWGDAPDEATEKIIFSYGDKIEYHRYPESIWATGQWKIKESLFRYVIKHLAGESNPWVLAFDFDELFDDRLTREKLEELANRKATAYEFNFIQLWDDENHMRVDGGWGDFWNVRFFKYQPEQSQEWLRKPLHCGLWPIYARRQAIMIPYIVRHYGYMNPAHRKKKVERYDKYDPQRVYQDKEWYQSMKYEATDERMIIREFNETDYINRILPQMLPKYQKETKITMVNSKQVNRVYMVRRLKDNRIQEMSSKQYTEMTANGNFKHQYELIGDVKTGSGLPEAPVVDAPIIEAPIEALEVKPVKEVEFKLGKLDCACGYKAKTVAGLKKHQKKHE